MGDLDVSQTSSDGNDHTAKNEGEAILDARALPLRTPLWEAAHADWYRRQALIKEIQEASDSRLICYLCGKSTLIDRDDAMGFVELLYSIPQNTNIDLLLH